MSGNVAKREQLKNKIVYGLCYHQISLSTFSKNTKKMLKAGGEEVLLGNKLYHVSTAIPHT